MKRLRKLISVLVILCLTLIVCAVSCTSAEESGMTGHKIGVPTYNINDAQVRMFKEYLDSYIRTCFEDVEFIYSQSLTNADEMMAFLQLCADQGCEAIMSFNTYDLKQEVEFCAANNMYYIRPSSNSSDEDFEAVADNPWFLGEIGPGSQLETQACIDMIDTMAKKDDGQNYIILSGGAFMGVEMHRIRTVAMLQELQKVYGVTFDKAVEELALSAEPTEITADELSVMICPGFVELPQFGDPASEAINSGKYKVVLSTTAVTPLMDALSANNVTCGATDCFSEDNFFGFKKGKVSYIAGKYESEIGPAFAAVYNAINGGADLYRPDGKAFRLEQGFWTAADETTYDSMYAMSCGIVINAYSCEDLYSVISVFNKDTNFELFKTLVESYSYEDAIARRAF